MNAPLLILDLDETLIHAAERPLARECDFSVGPYFVYRRPGLAEFLTSVAESYRLAVWSSSSSDYLTAILQHIVPAETRLEFAWSRERCVNRYHPELMERYWVKDLRKVKRLGYDLAQVLIVDDTALKVERNFGNAVYVRSFEGDPQDRELFSLAPYLKSLADHEDFRRIEKRNWRKA
jgi:RNA polymerase II subunit A small phosphatase-like protein